ncbi:MAG: PDZ domain-containing protein [Anaerolineaceae bacterium]|jgi:2-alkenal reductase|nr:MAG: PDZ domain-containing protein [Anaerolineaceae bacterium]
MLKRKYTLISSFILLALVLSACSTVQESQTQLPAEDTQIEQSEENNVPDQVLEYTQGEDALVDIYQKVNPGVVSILVYTSNGGVGQGSGFVYDLEGHIITNYHVIENATEIEITFPEGTRTRGEVIGTDVDSDLAVVKVDVAEDVLHPLTLGSSSDLAVGQFVIAIGNPYGFTGTMTTGIVSALGRVLDSMRSTGSGSVFAAGDTIQTDAAINPGNSGGPLLNLNGEVVGINRAIYDKTLSVFESASYNGIGFAIPIDIVKKVIPYLISDGSYDYPYLGISSVDGLTMDEIEAMGFDPSIPGVYVLEVTVGGPAAKAGIKAGTRTTRYEGLYAGGDMIVALDGKTVKDYNALLTYLFMNKAPGDSVTVTVLRNGTEKDIKVTLGSRSEQ